MPASRGLPLQLPATIILLRFRQRRRVLAAAPLTVENDSVLLVQLTDSHLFAEAGGKLLGMDTAESLQRVVDLVLEVLGWT